MRGVAPQMLGLTAGKVASKLVDPGWDTQELPLHRLEVRSSKAILNCQWREWELLGIPARVHQLTGFLTSCQP